MIFIALGLVAFAIEQLNTLGVALIVAVVGPVLLSWLSGRQRRTEAKENYERQEALAAQAKANADHQNENNEQQNAKLDKIHVLVNSSMTRAIENELDARKAYLVSLEEVVSLKTAVGGEPTKEALEAIKKTKARITELTAILKDRKKHH